MSADNQPTSAQRTIKATEFRAKCLKLMDEVAESGGEIVITKNGKPVAKLTAYRERPKSPFGLNQGRYEIIGDLDDPLPDADRERPKTFFGLNRGRYIIHGDLDDALLDVEWDAETGKNWEGLI